MHGMQVCSLSATPGDLVNKPDHHRQDGRAVLPHRWLVVGSNRRVHYRNVHDVDSRAICLAVLNGVRIYRYVTFFLPLTEGSFISF